MDNTFTLDSITKIAKHLINNSLSKVILFYGEMGVGKTTLIKEVGKQLGVTDVMSSPTFSIVNEYECLKGKVYHFDFYRIHDEAEALDIGIEDYFYSHQWVLIEWPEKIPNLLPNNANKIEIIRNNNESRTIIYGANE